MAERQHVVVDGSNLATEGRTTPSLSQLDEAVRTFADEHPDAEIVVVVDASFEHRIDPSERRKLEEAELHGEVVSPPAGAIGRGDAFVLRIAERTGAVVLSNDSFQEFHAEHPWLFEPGRLIGGKPVPGVGWIFTPRIPVRGPKSRQAKREAALLPATVKAAELAKAARKAARAVKRPGGAAPQVGDVFDPVSGGALPPGPVKAPAKKAAKRAEKATEKAVKAAKKAKPVVKAAKKVKEPVAKAAKKAKPVEKAAKKAKVADKTVKKTAKKAAPKPEKVAKKAVKAAAAQTTAKPKKAVKKVAVPVVSTAAAKKAAAVEPVADTQPAAAAAPAGRTASARRRGAAVDRRVRQAIDAAIAEVMSPPEPAPERAPKGKAKGKAAIKHRHRTAGPPPAVNEPLAFINFVATYPVGSEVEGEVASYTSHGAMVDVPIPGDGGLHCYIPLAGLGNPPPRKAREVLRKGERRQFVLVSLDPPRRVAELSLPGVVENGA